MKKKIAILTQPLGHNYGGIIQNYALQKVLKDWGYEPITLDIRKNINYFGNEYTRIPNNRRLYYFFLNETKHRLEGKRKVFPSKFYYNYIHRNTIKFIKKNINRTSVFYDTNSLKLYFEDNNFNFVIVGSDQVWRPIYSPNIYNFYLDFLLNTKSIKKIAYAASFGVSNWEYDDFQTAKCKKLIKDFDSVSVREVGGIDLCKKYLDIDSDVVLDPTLLLNKDDYIKLFRKNRIKRKGIFSYVLDKSDEKNNIINSIKESLNKEVFTNHPNYYYRIDKNQKPSEYKIPPLEDWLQSFHDADFIITDSFHGTVFSIIFQKPFIVLLNADRGADRFNSLLNQLGLQNRIYNSKSDLQNFYDIIDYSIVNTKLEKLRKRSFNYLKNSLGIF